MTPEELLLRLREIISTTPANELLATYRGFKRAHSPEDQQLLDVGMDLYAEGLPFKLKSRFIVVALIHGIRTTGTWQEMVRSVMREEQGVVVAPIGYGFFDLIRFLGPWRKTPIERVQIALRDLQRLHPGSELVLVAHSFGTHIVSKILKNSPDIRISRLLLCGSIIPVDYRWDQISHEFNQQSLINEVGTKDYWPVFARVASWGYGCSGSFGFKAVRVWDRFFAYGHSDFFSEDHFRKFWCPFILHRQVVDSPWDSQRLPSPWLITLLGSVPMVKILILFLITAIFAIGYFAVVEIGVFFKSI